jgi:hypothetical protein
VLIFPCWFARQVFLCVNSLIPAAYLLTQFLVPVLVLPLYFQSWNFASRRRSAWVLIPLHQIFLPPSLPRF